MPRHSTDPKHVDYLLWIHTRVTRIILCTIFLMHVSTEQRLNQSGQGSKKYNLPFMRLTRLWRWNEVKVIKTKMTIKILSKVILKQNLKNLALTVSEERPTFFPNEEICHLSPLCGKKKRERKKKGGGGGYTWSAWRTSASYKVSTKLDKNKNFRCNCLLTLKYTQSLNVIWIVTA